MTTKRKICPTELDMSDKKCNKMQDMSDRARCVRQKLQKKRKICPTELDMSDRNYKKKRQDMSDRARFVRQK